VTAESVLLVRDGALAEVVLNRPESINAVNDQMAARFLTALEEARDAGVRALVVRGEGRGFCSGRDLTGANPADEDATAILEQTFNPMMRALASFPAPTFAAVHGPALGVGLGLALACDVTYVADDARIGSPFARIGAVLDSGAHYHLVRRIGVHRTLELVYTGRLLSGIEAAAWGIVNRSMARVTLLDQTLATARAVAAGPTLAFLESKRLAARIVDEGLSFEVVLTAEAAAQGAACQTDDYREGIGAFQEKRKPKFTGS
jgi:enoyl-CoA hydratase/carnithine racemase